MCLQGSVPLSRTGTCRATLSWHNWAETMLLCWWTCSLTAPWLQRPTTTTTPRPSSASPTPPTCQLESGPKSSTRTSTKWVILLKQFNYSTGIEFLYEYASELCQHTYVSEHRNSYMLHLTFIPYLPKWHPWFSTHATHQRLPRWYKRLL